MHLVKCAPVFETVMSIEKKETLKTMKDWEAWRSIVDSVFSSQLMMTEVAVLETARPRVRQFGLTEFYISILLYFYISLFFSFS